MAGNVNLSVVHTFIDELWRFGVRHICISPGSRSTPVTMSVASHGGFHVHTLLDERSGGFFALGLAKRLQAPVLLVCTSGTATANYHPAAMEALQSRVPLLILTADRPPELHHLGANQTVNQNDLFGSHVKWSVQMPVPMDTQTLHKHAATTAWRASLWATTVPMGPVHINWPFREPLVPVARDKSGLKDTEVKDTGTRRGLAFLGTPTLEPSDEAVSVVARHLETSHQPLIISGPQDNALLGPALLALAKEIQAPVLADPLSGMRSAGDVSSPHVLDAYDWYVDADMADNLCPDLVLRFGRTPTSKGLLQYLGALTGVRQVVCSEDPEWMDPVLAATDVVIADPVRFAKRLVSSVDGKVTKHSGEWLTAWHTQNEEARQAASEVAQKYESDVPFEGRLWLELVPFLKDIQNLFVGNSMPVRDMDGFFRVSREPVNVYANRGVSGIDGVVSSAAGTAAALHERTLLVIGDVSFYHDLSGLLAVAKEKLPLCVVLVHNDGGGIFTGLPQAAVPETFEYFQTPHGLDFAPVVQMYGGQFHSVHDWPDFAQAMHEVLASEGFGVVEVRTSATKSTEIRRAIRQSLKE